MLKRNEGTIDRILRVILATVLLSVGLFWLGGLQGSVAGLVVTGFGLLGHLNEIALGIGFAATVDLNSVPWLPGVEQLAASGYVTGA